jgi:iron complex outermembrane receptor protein
MVNGELSKNVAGRLSFSSRTNSGYSTNVLTGNQLGDHDSTAARGSLLFTPSENTTIQLSADTYVKSGGSIPSKLIYASRPPLTPGAPPEPDPVAQQWIDGLGDREQMALKDGYEDVDSDSVTLKMTFDLNSITLTSLTNYRTSFYDWNQISTGQPYPEGITYQVYDYQYGPGNVFSSNCFGPFFPPGQRACWGSANSNTYSDGYDSPYWEQWSRENVDQWSQELRLSSNNDGRFNWMVGAYYGVEEIRRVDEVDFAIRFGDGYQFPCCFADPGGPFLVGGGRWHEGHEYKGSNADVDTLGLFFSVDFELSDSVRLSLGSRYSEDTKDFWMDLAGRILAGQTTDENGDGTGAYDPDTGIIYPGIGWMNQPSDEWMANPGTPTVDNNLEIVPITFGEKDSWDNVSSFVSLSWRVSDATMFYGRIAQGFKGGGYEGLSATGITQLLDTKFDEETALNYELGFKTDFWDGRARVNLSGFFTEYEGLQMQVLVPEFDDVGNVIEVHQLTTNVGDAEILGAELEFTFLPFDGMTVSGSYGYLDTEIKDDVLVEVDPGDSGADPPIPPTIDNFRGNELAKSPNSSVNLAADYGWSLSNGKSAYLRVDYSWTDENFAKPNNLTVIPSQDFIDASFGLIGADGKWELRIFGRNLTDELILAHIGDSGDPSERFRNFRFYHDLAAPRTYGVAITWNY